MKQALSVVFAAATAAVMFAGAPAPAVAQEYPWCAQYGGGSQGGGRNCGFVTYEQCMAALWGNGGFCERNLFYREGDPRLQDRAPRRRPPRG